ncbi:hypothetical protein TNCT_177331 [Trichonephila clavata]|uniref:Uncharacterized protein n=1 Tax=Trichonephila clavata TaxID=2740835 RepID=A0A8X6EYA4_TRICU|nr:hypothetical protein TNCT_177331 [Trichonephila clavata]
MVVTEWSQYQCNFPANAATVLAERRMLLLISWALIIYKMQGNNTVDFAVIYLGQKLFAAGQEYAALSRVKSLFELLLDKLSLDGLLIEEKNCSKLTGIKVS